MHFKVTTFTIRNVSNKIGQTLLLIYIVLEDKSGINNVVCILQFWAAAALKVTLNHQIFFNPLWGRTVALYIKQPAPQTGSGVCVTSQHVPLFFPSLSYWSLLHLMMPLTSYLVVWPILTEAGSSENPPDASTDMMIYSVVTSLKNICWLEVVQTSG